MFTRLTHIYLPGIYQGINIQWRAWLYRPGPAQRYKDGSSAVGASPI